MKWTKVPGVQKWVGKIGKTHVATILKTDKWRMWLDAGKGMQEVNSEQGFGIQSIREMQAKAVNAFGVLQLKIAYEENS